MNSKYTYLPSLQTTKTVVVPQSMENNLPALSQELYGNPFAWDLLFYANDLKDPLDVPTGTLLKVPDYQAATRKKTSSLGSMA